MSDATQAAEKQMLADMHKRVLDNIADATGRIPRWVKELALKLNALPLTPDLSGTGAWSTWEKAVKDEVAAWENETRDDLSIRLSLFEKAEKEASPEYFEQTMNDLAGVFITNLEWTVAHAPLYDKNFFVRNEDRKFIPACRPAASVLTSRILRWQAAKPLPIVGVSKVGVWVRLMRNRARQRAPDCRWCK